MTTIHTEEQYNQALKRVYELLQLHLLPDTPVGNELDSLVTLVEQYEAIHYPMKNQK